MNDIIRKIEAEQLKENVPQFNVTGRKHKRDFHSQKVFQRCGR